LLNHYFQIQNGETDVHHPSLYYISNRSMESPPKPQEPNVHRITQGVHVVSNSFLDDWNWPKVKFLRDEMEKLLAPGKPCTVEEMRDNLAHILTSRPLLPEKSVPPYIKEEISKFCRSRQDEYKNSVTSINSGITMHLNEFDEMLMETTCNVFVGKIYSISFY
jgi:hypothetical protein